MPCSPAGVLPTGPRVPAYLRRILHEQRLARFLKLCGRILSVRCLQDIRGHTRRVQQAISGLTGVGYASPGLGNAVPRLTAPARYQRTGASLSAYITELHPAKMGGCPVLGVANCSERIIVTPT